MLKDFAFFPPHIFSQIEKLYQLIDKEDEYWGKPRIDINGNINKYPILLNYLTHTFIRIQEEQKLVITKDETKCAFNTGLLTPYPYYEQIYAIFVRNKNIEAKSRWVSAGFCRESESKLRLHSGGIFPKQANYFGDSSKLIFNPTKKITPNFKHIIEENKERLPHLLSNMTVSDRHQKLMWAITIINKQISVDYKLAVPQYYKNDIQLLLPLSITEEVNDPELALVVKEYSNDYAATTCLTMDMAYNNARLIAKPHSNWLKPSSS